MADKPLLADADAVEAGRVQNEPLAPGDISVRCRAPWSASAHTDCNACVVVPSAAYDAAGSNCEAFSPHAPHRVHLLCTLLYRFVHRVPNVVPLCVQGGWPQSRRFTDFRVRCASLWCGLVQMCGSTALYGYLMMAFSGCQVIASPAFNTWAVKRTVKEALLVALLCLLVGNLVYALAAFTLEDTCELPNASVCAPLFVYQNITQGGVTSPSKRTLADVGACGSDRQMGLLMLFLGRAIAGFGGGAKLVVVAWGLVSKFGLSTVADHVGSSRLVPHGVCVCVCVCVCACVCVCVLCGQVSSL